MKYIRLYLSFIKFSFAKLSQFRLDFVFRILMDIVIALISLAFFKIIYSNTTSLAGLSANEAIMFCGAFIFTDGVYMSLFANNTWYFPDYINKGQLDYYLIRPVNGLFFILTREIAVSSFVNAILGLLVLIYAYNRLELEWYLCFAHVGLLFLGSYIDLMIRTMMILPTFWMQGGRGLDEMYWTIEPIKDRPHPIFPKNIVHVFSFVIPVFMINSFPTFIILRKDFLLLAIMIGVAVSFTALVALFWKIALKNYSSASS